MRSRRLLAIDWDDVELRAVEAVVGLKGVRLARALAVRFPPGLWEEGPTSVGRFIRQVLREHGVRARTAVSALPRSLTILKDLDLPSLEPEDVTGAVYFQSMKDLSFPIDQAVVDHAVTEASARRVSRVLVAVARQEVVSRYEAIGQAAGLRLRRLGLRPFATLEAFVQARPEASPPVVLVLDVGPKAAEVDIVGDGKLLFSRVVSVAGYAYRASADTGALERVAPEEPNGGFSFPGFLNELHRAIQAYRLQPGASPIEAVYVAEGSVGLAEILQRLPDQLRLPVEAFDPTRGLSRRRAFQAPEASLSATVGLLLAERTGGRPPLDFLHPKKPLIRRDPRKRIAVLVGVLLALAAGWALRQFNARLAGRQQHLAALQAELAGLKERHGRLMEIDRGLTLVRSRLTNAAVWLDELYRLGELFPGNRDAFCKQVTFAGARFPSIKKFRAFLAESRPKAADAPLETWLFPSGPAGASTLLGRIDLRGAARDPSVVDQFRERLLGTATYRPSPRPVVQVSGAQKSGYPFSFDLNIDVYRPAERAGAAAGPGHPPRGAPAPASGPVRAPASRPSRPPAAEGRS